MFSVSFAKPLRAPIFLQYCMFPKRFQDLIPVFIRVTITVAVEMIVRIFRIVKLINRGLIGSSQTFIIEKQPPEVLY